MTIGFCHSVQKFRVIVINNESKSYFKCGGGGISRRPDLDSSVGIATGYWLDGRGSTSDRSKRLFFSPQRQVRLWGPPSLLSNMHLG
jgi:hypothetical protein